MKGILRMHVQYTDIHGLEWCFVRAKPVVENCIILAVIFFLPKCKCGGVL